ncbi:ubiquinol-cytochrome C reductase hinge protein-domain-containing protein [Achaetomium macrosporum]|uniref:Cytochrome b-c1 complex subunit 6, mitochondrial n=1 Tax=Achaetomium macrosporum TaxID=79813 RepID=A0AAN7CH96_9PEZI|nr:ubiquinol-cytochrome C reductase hinge protein-domain-containing protein [Achaetomium macrosporum]
MGFWDTITDLVEAATPWATADAEAPGPARESTEETTAESMKEEANTEAESAAAEEEEAEEEEEEEEEEEVVDPKEQLEEECRNSKQCAPAKHHFDECVERVTNAQATEGGAKEDCVEEFFHLAHCATQCAAPKLWSILK